MKRKVIKLILMGFIFWGAIACSSAYRGENRVQYGEFILPQGVYEDKSWNERLKFSRTSFYRGATLHYDILAARVGPDSPYRHWFEQDLDMLSKCQEFFVLLLYKGLRSPEGHTDVIEQVTSEQRTELTLLSFKRHLQQHPLITQLHYENYAVRGLCDNELGQLENLKLSLSGFKEAAVKIPLP